MTRSPANRWRALAWPALVLALLTGCTTTTEPMTAEQAIGVVRDRSVSERTAALTDAELRPALEAMCGSYEQVLQDAAGDDTDAARVRLRSMIRQAADQVGDTAANQAAIQDAVGAGFCAAAYAELLGLAGTGSFSELTE